LALVAIGSATAADESEDAASTARTASVRRKGMVITIQGRGICRGNSAKTTGASSAPGAFSAEVDIGSA
jgi:hypothetical protein